MSAAEQKAAADALATPQTKSHPMRKVLTFAAVSKLSPALAC